MQSQPQPQPAKKMSTMPSLSKAKLNFKTYRSEATFKVDRIFTQVRFHFILIVIFLIIILIFNFLARNLLIQFLFFYAYSCSVFACLHFVYTFFFIH